MYQQRLGRDRETGKAIRVTVYGRTPAELKRNIADTVAQHGGTLKARERGTVRDLVESWLENEILPNRRKTTYANYHGLLTKHALPLLEIPLERFDADAVDRLYAAMRAKGVKPSVVHRISLCLRTAFEGRRRRTGVANPFDLAAKPRHANAETAILDVDQVRALLAAARAKKDRYEALLAVLGLGGLRLGEALALKWPDIDFTHGVLTVRQQLTEINGVCEIAVLKTKRSRREIPLPKMALDALKRRAAAAEKEKHKSVFVFVTPGGAHPMRSNLRRDTLEPLLTAAQLPRVTFHGLRGSAATALAHSGTDLATIGSILGQAKPSVTLERYVHASEASQRRAIETLNSALGARPKRKKK